jgi:hypothetical protein
MLQADAVPGVAELTGTYLMFRLSSLAHKSVLTILCHWRLAHFADAVFLHQIRRDLNMLHRHIVRVR